MCFPLFIFPRVVSAVRSAGAAPPPDSELRHASLSQQLEQERKRVEQSAALIHKQRDEIQSMQQVM